MDVVEAIHSRRSIRKFKPDAVSEADIKELINAGRLAPSGTNLQPTRYVIIKGDDTKAKLKECTPLPFVSAAPVVIACCIDKNSILTSGEKIKELREAQAFVDTPLDKELSNSKSSNDKGKQMDETALHSYLNLNAAIAIDHITLRAMELGLGSCWVMMFDKEKIKNVLDLEDQYDVVALLPIGYPDQSPKQRPRLSMEEVLLKEV